MTDATDAVEVTLTTAAGFHRGTKTCRDCKSRLPLSDFHIGAGMLGRTSCKAQKRAERKGLDYELTKEWAASAWTGRCAVTDAAFVTSSGGRRSHFAPSLDRIEPRKGYIPSNCRFVLWCVNSLKNDRSDEEMFDAAELIAASRGGHGRC